MGSSEFVRNPITTRTQNRQPRGNNKQRKCLLACWFACLPCAFSAARKLEQEQTQAASDAPFSSPRLSAGPPPLACFACLRRRQVRIVALFFGGFTLLVGALCNVIVSLLSSPLLCLLLCMLHDEAGMLLFPELRECLFLGLFKRRRKNAQGRTNADVAIRGDTHVLVLVSYCTYRTNKSSACDLLTIVRYVGAPKDLWRARVSTVHETLYHQRCTR